MPAEVLGTVQSTNRQSYKTVSQGTTTTIVVATSPLLADVTERYFEDCNEAEVIGPEDPDPGSAARLWELSRKALS